MKTIIIYYSYTGNNALLAESVAKELQVPSFRLSEPTPRTTKTIILDMLFQRRPKLAALPQEIESYDLVIFMGPIWMYHLPSPLRACFAALKGKIKKYAFVSMSGGALGPNTGIAKELVRRLGKRLVMYLDLNAAHLCSVAPSPGIKETSEYQLSNFPHDLERLSRIVSTALGRINSN